MVESVTSGLRAAAQYMGTERNIWTAISVADVSVGENSATTTSKVTGRKVSAGRMA
jgi:hypothetical protein